MKPPGTEDCRPFPTAIGFPQVVEGTTLASGVSWLCRPVKNPASTARIAMKSEKSSPPIRSDEHTSVRELRELVAAFVEERDWRQFHAPKNLAMSLAIEAAELMEHFQWLTVPHSRELREDFARRSAIAEELADVFSYLLAMANELEIDLSSAVRDKMLKNAKKYPVEEYRGRYGPDDD